jgi:hypothetical protein
MILFSIAFGGRPPILLHDAVRHGRPEAGVGR